ncbi:MAG: hypothetical protein B6242_04940 [Anaerolineaceae bacterium 4572_78]|nr:MAG: hypothetical protein B6242_04940 [Anaerolineaceae bacterium 4572_78]
MNIKLFEYSKTKKKKGTGKFTDYLFIFVCLILLFLIGYNEDEEEYNMEEVAKLEESLIVWNTEKAKYNEIVERQYNEFDRDGTTDSWSENKKEELGTHQEGAELKLIDTLYRECKNMLLTTNPSKNYIDLSFNENGILQTCTYSHKDCADDCSSGVRIDTIEFLEEKSP